MQTTQKHFRKRDAILNCVMSTQSHPSAEWVYEHVRQEVPDISLATVYRNLALFKEQGLITSVATVKGVERFDGNTEPHVHFICTECNAVTDLHQLQVPHSLNEEAEGSIGCSVQTCQLSFTGICHGCLNKEKETM